MSETMPEISVVIPVFNEASSLPELVKRVTATLEGYGRPFEVVFVDDGSSDGSLELMDGFRQEDKRVRVVKLARNFGQTPALFAGFANVRGRIITMLDADLQNPPEELPRLIDKIEEGYDFVSGRRVGRKDSFLRRLPSRVLNYIVWRVTRADLHDQGCALKAFRREIVDRLALLKHHSRYLAIETLKLGARFAEIEVHHDERRSGESKYRLFDLIRINFDIITSVTSAPLQFIGVIGWVLAFVGFAMAARVLYFRLIHGDVNYLGTVVAIFFAIAGVQMIATGMMCEYVSRIFIEVQNRPYYVVQEILEHGDEARAEARDEARDDA